LVTKKVVALLVMPAGLVWLGLMALAAWPGMGRWWRGLALAALVLHTLAGNVWFGAWLLRGLEAPYTATAAPREPFDAICVLGGGTSFRPDGQAQLGPSGDRLLVPVRLYREGLTTHLVASGLNATAVDGPRSLADDTADLWRLCGVPEGAIVRDSTARTTAAEIRVMKQLAAARGWRRVGVCSSAWHLRRVEQLCRAEGFAAVPVAADFLSAPVPPIAMYAVPQARGFQYVQKAIWEYLGGASGG
jgi:uncharacterized SAM-binding protein YcdF (DUF218 family)